MSEPTPPTTSTSTTTNLINSLPTPSQLANTLPSTTQLKASIPSSNDLADAIPIPTLEEAPLTSKLRSHLIIIFLITSSILAAYTYGFELLQVADHTSFAEMGISLCMLVMVGGGTFWWVGAHKIDWWELVLGYWWFSMPVALGAGILLVRLMEGSEELAVKD